MLRGMRAKWCVHSEHAISALIVYKIRKSGKIEISRYSGIKVHCLHGLVLCAECEMLVSAHG